MKRIVSLTLVVLMIAALFVGCGSDSVPGTYKLKKINDKGVKEFFDDLGMDLSTLGVDASKLEDMMTMTLKDDGTVEIADNMDGSGETVTGTWKQDGDKVTISAGGEDMELTFKSGALTYTVEESGIKMSMTLEK